MKTIHNTFFALIGLTVALMLAMSCSSDNPVNSATKGTVFEHIIGGTGSDIGRSVILSFDGGYVIAGSTSSSGHGSSDIYILKTDSLGDTLWSQTYGGAESDFANSVNFTSDGGYIIAGQTSSFGAGSNDLHIVRTDSIGNFVWSKSYGGVNLDIGASVRETLDGGFIIAGYTSSFGEGETDVYLVKTDINGDLEWSNTFGGTGTEFGTSVIESSEGGYVIAGYTESFGEGSYDVYLIKTDSNGDSLWTRTYGGAEADIGSSIIENFRGEYVISGFTDSFGAGLSDVYLIKTDKDGDTLWTRTFGGDGNEIGNSVESSTNGSYIIAGSKAKDASSTSDLYLIKIDINGTFVWDRTFGGSSTTDVGLSVKSTADAGYIVTGRTSASTSSGIDLYLIKTDANGNLH